MRQPLKQLNEIFEPDPRSAAFVKFDAAGMHAKTLDDHYRHITAIRMSDRVPATIRDEFETIRNLYLYSWYVYEFTVPAILYAHALIEKTIKEKCARHGMELSKRPRLGKLMQLSIRQGWLTNADFAFALEPRKQEPDPNGPTAFRSVPRYLPIKTDYCERLAETLPKIRNMGAHGKAGLGFPSTALRSIEICACIANALFRDPVASLESQDANPIR